MKKAIRTYYDVLTYIAVVGLVGLLACVALQVFARVFLPKSPNWTEEAAGFLFIFMVGFAGNVAVGKDEYVGVELLTERFPEKVQKIIKIAVLAALWVFSVIIFSMAVVGPKGLLAMTPASMVSTALFAGLNSFTLLCIPGFVLCGSLMNQGDLTSKLIGFVNKIVGHITGGLAIANVGVSMLFAGISGTALADTVSVGGVLIPAMKKEGYDADFSCAVTAASSCIGPIIPPSVPMIIAATQCNLSVSKMFMAGMIPGILMGVGMIGEARFLRRSLECAVVMEAATKASEEEIQQLMENMALQRFYLENGMSTKLLEVDNQFHRRLFEITGKQRVYGMMKNFVIHLDRLRNLTMMTIKEIKIVEDHNSILQAIMEHDPEKACERMRKHLNRDSTDIYEIRKAHPDYFMPAD